ncbi:MAG: GDSL-type esterase/lipase family protein [Eubacteriales bacterium]
MSGKWMKKLALFTAVIMLVMILPAASVSAAATKDYVALGDSIGYGYTDPVNGGYADLYAEYLGDEYLYTNLCTPGDTTLDLQSVIHTNWALLKRADIITVSIGSNNLLGPSIAALAGLYGLDAAAFQDPDGADLMTALALAIQADRADGGVTPEQRLSLLTDMSKPEAQKLNTSLAAGTLLFTLQWPTIMTQLHLLAPNAKIYVNNLYNPLLSSKISSASMEPLYKLLNIYMQTINLQISRYTSRYNYQMIDVYKLFADPAMYANLAADPLSAPVSFNIPAALAIAGSSYNPDDPNQFALFFFACDPHPTTVGHMLIFEKLKLLH